MKDKVKYTIVTIVFGLYLVAFLVINIVKSDTEISTSERRKLASFPSISVQNIFNGKVMDSFDKYSMDQFIYRDGFRNIKSLAELNIFRKKDVNKVYIYNDMLIKEEYPLNNGSINNVIGRINYIKEEYLKNNDNVYYSVIPDKNYFINKDYLKMDYELLFNRLNNEIKDVKYIDITKELELNDYYKTYTHWKQTNILKVVDKISKEMNFNDRLYSEYNVKDITSFEGVLKGQIEINGISDTISILTNNIIENSTVYNLENKEYEDVYNMNKLDSLDKYDIFLSGATPLLYIENNNSSSDKDLIIFRDSFGSSISPLFISAYKHITLVDIRYIASRFLNDYTDYLDFNNSDVLFLYSTLVINNSSALK